MKKIISIVAAISLTVLLHASEQAILDLFPEGAECGTVPIMEEFDCRFTLPDKIPKDHKIKLEFDARIDHPNLGGAPGFGLVVMANDKPLPSRSLVSMPDRMRLPVGSTGPGDDIYLPYRFKEHHGAGKHFEQLCQTGAFSLSLTYSPDFDGIDSPRHEHRIIGFSRKHFVFDITEFCHAGDNSLAFINHLPKWIISAMGNKSQLPMKLRNLRVAITDEPLVKPQPYWMTEFEELGKKFECYSPRKEWKTNYNWSVDETGKLTIESANRSYNISTTFSFQGGQNGFPRPHDAEQGWNVVRTEIAGDAVRLTANASAYSVRRDFIPGPLCLEIRDTVKNTSGEILPMAVRHSIPLPSNFSEIYMGGQLGQPSVAHGSPAWMKENPTAWIGNAEGVGIGLAAYDDIMRLHLDCFAANGILEFRDMQLALAPGRTVTAIWQLYPVENGGYCAFINNVRHRWGLNSTQANFYGDDKGFDKPLPPNWKTVKWKSEEDREFHWCIVHPFLHGSGSGNGPSWGLRQWGNEPLHKNQLETLASLRRGFQDIEIVAGVAAMYFSNAGDEDLARFKDCVMTRKDGSYPMEDGCRFFIPTLHNDFGRLVEANVQRYLDWGFDGVWFDYMEGSRGDQRFTYNQYDGVSGDIDPKTGKLLATKASYQLLSQEFLQHLCRMVQAQGKKVYGNLGNSTTSNMHALNSFIPMRWAEAIDIMFIPRGELYPCPNSLCRSPENLHTQILIALMEGMMASPYGLKYSHEGDNPLKAMWPIAYREMHRGFVIGEDKIVTAISGRFGFGDKSDLKYKLFDDRGIRKDVHFALTTVDGKTFLDVRMKTGEVAVIERVRENGSPTK